MEANKSNKQLLSACPRRNQTTYSILKELLKIVSTAKTAKAPDHLSIIFILQLFKSQILGFLHPFPHKVHTELIPGPVEQLVCLPQLFIYFLFSPATPSATQAGSQGLPRGQSNARIVEERLESLQRDLLGPPVVDEMIDLSMLEHLLL